MTIEFLHEFKELITAHQIGWMVCLWCSEMEQELAHSIRW
jgi:hypothetical protein